MFPYEKYRYFTNNKDLVVAEQTYAGKKYRGTAKLGESDEFKIEDGKNLAAARCDDKICRQRLSQARAKYAALKNLFNEIEKMLEDARKYYDDAFDESSRAKERLAELELSLGLTPELKKEHLTSKNN